MTFSQPSIAEESSAETRARVYNLKGNAAFKRGDDEAARDNYQKSLKLHESFDTFCKLGRVEESLQSLSDSYFNLGLCLKLYPEDEELAGAREKYAALRNEVRAQISPEQMAAIDRRVEEYSTKTKTPPPDTSAAPPAEAGKLKTRSDESASSTELETPQVDPGLDETASSQGVRWGVSITVAGLGIGLAGASAGLLVDSAAKRKEGADLRESIVDEGQDCSEKDDQPDACKTLERNYDQADSQRTLGIIFAATGGTLVVGAAALYFLWPDPSEESAVFTPRGYRKVGAIALRPELTAGPTSWAFGLSGRF